MFMSVVPHYSPLGGCLLLGPGSCWLGLHSTSVGSSAASPTSRPSSRLAGGMGGWALLVVLRCIKLRSTHSSGDDPPGLVSTTGWGASGLLGLLASSSAKSLVKARVFAGRLTIGETSGDDVRSTIWLSCVSIAALSIALAF